MKRIFLKNQALGFLSRGENKIENLSSLTGLIVDNAHQTITVLQISEFNLGQLGLEKVSSIMLKLFPTHPNKEFYILNKCIQNEKITKIIVEPGKKFE